MTAMIEVQNVSKSIEGRRVVNHLSLVVEAGEIFALVGNNGSGKTCVMRLLATLEEPDSGDIQIGGYSVLRNKRDVRRLTGFLPEQNGVYSRMTVVEYLAFFASCYRVDKSSRRNLIADLLDLVDLSQKGDEWVETLSAGMLKRLGLARMLIHDPQVLVLDEPFGGLDPQGKVEFQNLMVELAKMGKTIFLSSHFMAETAGICSRAAVLEAGELAAAGDVATMMEQLAIPHLVKISVLDEPEAVKKLLEKVPVVEKVHIQPDHQANRHVLEMEFKGDDVLLSQVLTYLAKSGIQVVHFSADDYPLERVIQNVIHDPGK